MEDNIEAVMDDLRRKSFKERTFTHEGRMFRRTEAYRDGKLYGVFFERFVPETSVNRGLGKFTDRHACWRMVSPAHKKLLSKLCVL